MMKFLKNLDLTNNQLTNAALQNLASDGTPTTYGLIWYNTATNLVKYNSGNGSTIIRYLLHDGLLGVANGIATLDASVRLVQDAKTAWDGVGSRSFSQTPGNNTVVVSGATGKLAYGWFPTMDLLFANAQPTASVAMNGQRITGVLCDTSSAATDVATRGYVDGIAQGLKTKGSVRVATIVDAATFTIAAGDVTSITGTTIDGVALIAGDRVLVKDAPVSTGIGSAGSTQPANGIYTVVSAAGPITLARAVDMDTWAEVPAAYVWVEEGTTNADTGYVCTSNTGGTFKTTGITFTKFATSTGLASGVSGGTTNSIVYQSAPSTTSFIATVNSAIFTTNGSGVPSWSTSAIAVANGGTGALTFTAGYLKANGTTAFTTLATIPNTDGGTGWNSSGVTGIPYIAAGVWGSATAANIVGVISTTAVTNATNATNLLIGTQYQIPYQSGTGTTTFASAAANSVLATNGSNVPSLVRTLPALLSVSTAATVSAAGSTQGTATVLGADVNIVTTVGASQGVQLPVAVAGMKVTVINKGANILAVYPATGGAIDAIATNTAQNLAVNGMLEYTASSATQWYSTTNTVIPGVGSATNLTGGAANPTVVYQSTTGVTAYLANSATAAVMIQAAAAAAPSWVQYLPTSYLAQFTGGDVTSAANGSGVLSIGTNKVTLTQMAQVATATILGRSTAGTGNVEALTGTQARAIIGSPKSAVYTWTNADGATKTIAHGLGAVGTVDAIVRVYDSAVSPANEVYCDVTLTDAASGTITLSASAAPAVSYRVVVLFIGA
jgi:hypothetical protein